MTRTNSIINNVVAVIDKQFHFIKLNLLNSTYSETDCMVTVQNCKLNRACKHLFGCIPLIKLHTSHLVFLFSHGGESKKEKRKNKHLYHDMIEFMMYSNRYF